MHVSQLNSQLSSLSCQPGWLSSQLSRMSGKGNVDHTFDKAGTAFESPSFAFLLG